MSSYLENPQLLSKVIEKKHNQLQKAVSGVVGTKGATAARAWSMDRICCLMDGIWELEKHREVGRLVGSVTVPARTSPWFKWIESTSEGQEFLEIGKKLSDLDLPDMSRRGLLESRFALLATSGVFPELERLEIALPSKGVREGKTVDYLRTALREFRRMYSEKALTAPEIRKRTVWKYQVVWEWIDRISDPETKAEFLKFYDWENGDRYIFEKIATLYKFCPHLSKKPSGSTVRDWRKAYLGSQKHRTPDGRRPKGTSPPTVVS